MDAMVRKLSNYNSERKRDVQSEEARLWAEVTGDVEPLDGVERRVASKIKSHRQGRPGDVPTTGNSLRTKVKVAGSPVTKPETTVKSQGNKSEPLALDRRNLRRIGKGRISIDDRIDLHGMRQSQALLALKQFLLGAQAEQFKTVLVITGKGRLKSERSENWMDDREIGVLRREVPNWLRSEELKDMVIGFSNALPQHGGEGALYVRLRRG